ncbi:MAG: YaaA family protein [Campylobacteraceae bacterium]|nr:YaaA family protein [Campylobacteraceae bacterium]
MKILFSPSEDKDIFSPYQNVLENSLWINERFQDRKKCIDIYNKILSNKDEKELSKLFGFKNKKDIEKFLAIEFFTCKMQKAVLRYTGVAYNSLKYTSLDMKAQEFIDTNVMIFSNLLGPILASDKIPYYKLKQGESLRGFDTASYYKKIFSDDIDEWLGEDFTVDLRAAFYEKFYSLKKPHVTMKFYKRGKALSHFAKVCRGAVLRTIANYKPQNISDFEQIDFENLHIKEIKKVGLKTEYSFEIKA